MRHSFFYLVLSLLIATGASNIVGQQEKIEASVTKYRAHVLSARPHDREAFTQGLLMHEGKLYESTGLEGRSSLRRVDPVTGTVEKQVDLPNEYFGEGLALVDGKLIQLTWKNGKAFVYDLETFEQVGEFSYEGEGWGLATDGSVLFMTDGSDKITLRDPGTFEILETKSVTFQGKPVRMLNEMEYLDGVLFANVLGQEIILKIDAQSGEVFGLIDASNLLHTQETSGVDVLNGIAYDERAGSFLLTGKLWPKVFEVRFVEVGDKSQGLQVR